MPPRPTVPRPVSPSDFVFYHSEGDDKPIGHRSPVKRRGSDDCVEASSLCTFDYALSVCFCINILSLSCSCPSWPYPACRTWRENGRGPPL
jgi:hypothetical protein